MGNALGNLFADIANSIRDGLGDIGKMPPSSFPNRIDEIVAMLGGNNEGGGTVSGGTTSNGITYKIGTFDATDYSQEVTHGLGVLPDLVAVFRRDKNDSKQLNHLSGAIGCSNAAKSLFVNGSGMPTHSFTDLQDSADNVNDGWIPTNYGIESENNLAIYNATSTSFVVGGSSTTNTKLLIGCKYTWVAFAGFGVAVKEDSGATLENPIVATGTFVPTGDTIIFKHNLGVVPDCVVIRNLNSISGVVPSNCVLYAIGFRKDIPFGLSLQNHLLQATSGCQNISVNMGIEESGNDMAGFRNANATSITVGGWVGKLDTTAEYEWKATRIIP